MLDGVRLPADAMLPGAQGLGAPLSCLNEARLGIVFGAVGAGRDSLEAALAYAAEREVFGKPLTGYQLTQAKLADMTVALGPAMLLAIHLGRLKEAGTLRPEQVSLGKLNSVRVALDVARECRTILGGQRRHHRVLAAAAREQPRVGAHLRGHLRGAPAGDRPGVDRDLGLPLSGATVG